MVKYHRLTREERYQIQALWNSGLSLRAIARQLDRQASTISRELKKIGFLRTRYFARVADLLTEDRKRALRPGMQRIRGELENYVREKIASDWSPEQIAGRLRRESKSQVISYQTIYRYIERDKRARGQLWKHLRVLRNHRHGRKKLHMSRGQYVIADRVMIEERPEDAEQRDRLGDFERDTLLGTHNGSLLLSIVDRTSRLLKIKWLPNKSCELIHQATVSLLKNEYVRTITNDNGTEFARHRETAQSLKAKIYFSRAYRAWERGTNENTNGLLRQYFPRKTDIGHPSDEYIQQIENQINSRPKKCLGYKTPLEVHRELRQVLR